MIIRGRITRKKIEYGEPNNTADCPLGLSLRNKGWRRVKVTQFAVAGEHPDTGLLMVGILPGDIQDWVEHFDDTGKEESEPINYRLVLE